MFNIKKYPKMPYQTIKITCKDCNKTFDYNVPTEINIADYPELYNDITDPDFFELKCPKCKKSTRMFASFTYIDPRHRICLYVNTPNGNMTKLKYAVLDDTNSKIMRLKEQYYRTRIVSGLKEFAEKRELLELNIDDRTAEILKNYVRSNELKDAAYNTTNDIQLTYVINKNGNHFVNTYLDGKPFEQITINIDAYEITRLKIFKQFGETHTDKNILVNDEWAKNNEKITESLFSKH